MQVYFENDNAELTLIGETKDNTEARKMIIEDIQKTGRKIYYTRWWKDTDNSWVCDYGSWSSYYVIKGADENFLYY